MSFWSGRGAKVNAPHPVKLKVGDVVKARILADDNTMKPRRSVVLKLDAPDPAEKLRCILVIGTTTAKGKYDPANTVKFPPLIYHPMPYTAGEKSPPAPFDQRSAAKALWTDRFRRDELPDPIGSLTAAELASLNTWLNDFVAHCHAQAIAKAAQPPTAPPEPPPP